jgi:hypothetical protein
MGTFVREDRKETIATVIADELDRQSHTGASRIDVEALAVAVDFALDQGIDASAPRDQMHDAKSPEQLNATNDG